MALEKFAAGFAPNADNSGANQPITDNITVDEGNNVETDDANVSAAVDKTKRALSSSDNTRPGWRRWDSNPRPLACHASAAAHQAIANKGDTADTETVFTPVCTSDLKSHKVVPANQDLETVINAWLRLSLDVKVGILAMVLAARS